MDFIITTNAHLSFLAALPGQYPNLSILSLNLATHPRVMDVTSAAVIKWDQLLSLSVGGLSVHAFTHIATIPTLSFLSLKIPDTLEMVLPTFLESPFPALRSIAMHSAELSFSSRLLRLMSPGSALRSICIEGEEDSTAVHTWEDIIRTVVGTCLSSSLQCLSIEDYKPQNVEIDTAEQELVLPGNCIRPLLVFKNLTNVCLRVCHGIDLDDNLLLELAMALPLIQTLILTSAHKPRLARATLASFVSFAQHCQSMDQLSITLNARRIPAAPTVKICNPKMRILYVGLSPIRTKNAPKVAAFLSDLFPNLRTVINRYGDCREDETDPVTQLDKAWTQVDSLVTLFAGVRAQETRRMKQLPTNG
ncbi:hypothetical protein H0H81_010830 [Sphagnurus paluster]|uniref:Uncharacterized protein n=1 Tax=Sphagnurus paluster TaxID=117069 RepID=A0A9P7KKK5_9AGAR|nr:hypothetical protein H0H81_010830 [Sphagnurus paluster]